MHRFARRRKVKGQNNGWLSWRKCNNVKRLQKQYFVMFFGLRLFAIRTWKGIIAPISHYSKLSFKLHEKYVMNLCISSWSYILSFNAACFNLLKVVHSRIYFTQTSIWWLLYMPFNFCTWGVGGFSREHIYKIYMFNMLPTSIISHLDKWTLKI